MAFRRASTLLNHFSDYLMMLLYTIYTVSRFVLTQNFLVIFLGKEFTAND